MMPAVSNFNRLKTVGTNGVYDLISKVSLEHWYTLIPRHGPLTIGVWTSGSVPPVTTAGQALTQAALPYVVDAFPFKPLALRRANNPED
ncbi:hypothetical protein E4U40_003331 [Claviceps sp. LM458 group G5]|nr:hypothetical protein E4U40_003331 [Claviceps sp. LM458 group G5]